MTSRNGDLGTLGGGSYDQSSAFDINDDGQVVGWSDTADEYDTLTLHAFITGPNGIGMRDLGTLHGGNSSAVGINELGQVTGNSEITNEPIPDHAFITGPNGMGIRDIGTLGGNTLGHGWSSAYGINDAGEVVGWSHALGDVVNEVYPHAFITGANGVGIRDLGTLGGNYSAAYDINEAGQVVGEFSMAGGESHAFITGSHGMGIVELDSLVGPSQGVMLTSAVGINNNGQVIAYGSFIPEPETYALMLAGLGLIGFMAQRKKA